MKNICTTLPNVLSTKITRNKKKKSRHPIPAYIVFVLLVYLYALQKMCQRTYALTRQAMRDSIMYKTITTEKPDHPKSRSRAAAAAMNE